MKLNKIFFIAIMFFSSVLFANNVPKLWAHGDIINPIELSSQLNNSQLTVAAPDFLLEANWTAGDFGAGDTTQTYSLNHASIIYFVYVDSSKNTSSQGVDTLWIGITNTLSNGMIIDAPIKVQNMNQTTSTTFLSGAVLIPGNNTVTVYAFTQ